MNIETRKKILEKIKDIANTINRKDLRTIVLDLIENPIITFANVTPKISFLESPAAPKHHHAYPGGLIDHTYGVLRIALKLSDSFQEIYQFNVNKDLVISSAILHDIFKYYQYEKDPITGGFRSRQDWYLSHDFAIVAELAHRKAPDELIRVISEVHGTVPFTTIESQIVHWADTTDSNFIANLQNIIWYVCRDIETESNGKYIAIKTFYKALKKYPIFYYVEIYYKNGKDAIREFIKKKVLSSEE